MNSTRALRSSLIKARVVRASQCIVSTLRAVKHVQNMVAPLTSILTKIEVTT